MASPLLHGSRRPSTALYAHVVSTACAANCEAAALCIIRVDSPLSCAVSTSIAIPRYCFHASPNSHYSYLARNANNLTAPTPHPAIYPPSQPASHPPTGADTKQPRSAKSPKKHAALAPSHSREPYPPTILPLLLSPQRAKEDVHNRIGPWRAASASQRTRRF
jgi:hypothetical protein